MPKLTWLWSYETLKFDTVDGDIHKGQFAKYKDTYVIRLHPENNEQFTILDPEEYPNVEEMIKDLEEVHVLEGERMYYHVFLLPGDNRHLRVVTTKPDYDSLKVKIKPEKIASAREIIDFKKDDSKWQ